MGNNMDIRELTEGIKAASERLKEISDKIVEAICPHDGFDAPLIVLALRTILRTEEDLMDTEQKSVLRILESLIDVNVHTIRTKRGPEKNNGGEDNDV
ncbi:MAG: hypothetical protein ACI4F8_05295 [Lachnospiraceae bacterium]